MLQITLPDGSKRDYEGPVSVADVAASWGFWHLSHFAADYKAMFGELPSETLRAGSVRRQSIPPG